ncbi:hypothetical protein [Paraburkholderia sp. J63]|uniref:hypothetical protein n=1 Tax=Paraburkholderia sp. J63 TaxID=2805434 RepID=UPI002ABE2E1B|nr:hypothetical protein [Paraburkholderia sp. J63]
MNSAQVLTHPAFDRPPVLNARRHGPTPRGVPMLSTVRHSRRDDEANLRAWAREHANAYWTLDQIRRAKQWSDAKDLLEKRNDAIWQEVEQLQEDAAALLHEASRLKCLLVERQLGELAHE